MIILPLFLFSFHYSTQWSKIKKLDEQQLPKSALKLTKHIYNKNLEEKNETQFIKAVIFKQKYLFIQSEDTQAQSIYELEKELNKALKLSTKLLLKSLLAEFYMNYLDAYHYKIRQRTTVKNHPSKDINTWSIKQLVEKSTALYLSTLNPKTQTILMTEYQEILTKGKYVEDLYPTLYDFLAFRALNHFKNTRYYLH